MLLAGAQLAFLQRCWGAEPIDTDGPDFVESSETVPKGRFQYEVDITGTRASRTGGSETGVSTPALLKFGLTRTIELRIAPDGLVHQKGRWSVGDTALGVKWHTQDRDEPLGVPAISLLLHLDLATGSPVLRGHGVRPSVRSVITWDLPHEFALGVMPGFKVDFDSQGQRFAAGILGVVLNKKVSSLDRVFVEASLPRIASSRSGGTIASVDVGAAHLINLDTQIGMRVSLPANSRAPRGSVVFELAQRF